MAAVVTQIHCHAQRLIAVTFHIFKLAVADRNAQAIGLGDLRNSVACAQSFSLLQRFCDQVLKAALGELKGGGWLIGRSEEHGLYKFEGAGGYDTSHASFAGAIEKIPTWHENQKKATLFTDIS